MARPPVSAASALEHVDPAAGEHQRARRARASARAIAWPSPPLAPVTSAVRPPRFMARSLSEEAAPARR